MFKRLIIFSWDSPKFSEMSSGLINIIATSILDQLCYRDPCNLPRKILDPPFSNSRFKIFTVNGGTHKNDQKCGGIQYWDKWRSCQ